MMVILLAFAMNVSLSIDPYACQTEEAFTQARAAHLLELQELGDDVFNIVVGE